MISITYLKVNLPLNILFIIINIQYPVGYPTFNLVQSKEITVAPMVVCPRKSDGIVVGNPMALLYEI